MAGLKDSRPGSTDIKIADQKVATRINDFIWMSEGATNAYLIETADGAVLVNTGMGIEGPVHREAFAAVSSQTIRRIVILQGHVDHVGGIAEFLDDGPEVIAQERIRDCQEDDARIAGFRAARTARFYPDFIRRWQEADAAAVAAGMPSRQGKAQPTILVKDSLTFSQGSIDFELIHAPGGETVDSMLLWLPQHRILFTGNSFGPLFPHMPNFHTIRGDRLRFALPYLEMCDKVLALSPELMITGHFEPIAGQALIREEVARLRDAVRYVHDETVRGMNEGKQLHALMRDVRLPAHLEVGEDYGTVPWTVQAIWYGYGGWFLFQSSTELGHVPVRDIYADVARLAGADALIAMAGSKLAAGEPLAALHLIEIALAGEPDSAPAWKCHAAIHRELLKRAHSRNRWEQFWLKGELDRAESRLSEIGPDNSCAADRAE